jgi:hypothetical protein
MKVRAKVSRILPSMSRPSSFASVTVMTGVQSQANNTVPTVQWLVLSTMLMFVSTFLSRHIFRGAFRRTRSGTTCVFCNDETLW